MERSLEDRVQRLFMSVTVNRFKHRIEDFVNKYGGKSNLRLNQSGDTSLKNTLRVKNNWGRRMKRIQSRNPHFRKHEDALENERQIRLAVFAIELQRVINVLEPVIIQFLIDVKRPDTSTVLLKETFYAISETFEKYRQLAETLEDYIKA